MHDLITGIQQIGIGVHNAIEAKFLYRDLFRMEALIFDDKASATLMTQYTGNEVHDRHAILSMNMSGGGGFEIWQFTTRTPSSLNHPQYGDTGIFAAKIKCQNLQLAYNYYSKLKGIMISDKSRFSFWVKDSYGNTFQMIESTEWFHCNNHICGGVAGAVIGVSDMDKALLFYKQVLGLSEVITDHICNGDPFVSKNPESLYRTVLLRKSKNTSGAFSKLLGDIHIELVQPLTRTHQKIFKDRFWGDCGFIHLCFDVLDMESFKKHSKDLGFNFTVDSNNSYAMDSSAGRFCYVEDPDGTLIELVETHKIPIFKKLGLHLDIKKRKKNTPLPDWMVKMLSLNKIK